MATEAAVETAKTETKKVARKPAAKKAAKPAAESKVAFKDYFTKEKVQEAQAKVKESVEKAGDLAKDVVYANLGVYGKLYDTVSERLESLNDKVDATRKQAPKEWDALIKRGTQVQGSLEKAQEDLKAKVKSIDVKASVQSNVDKVKGALEGAVEKVKGAVKKAA